MMKPEIKIEDLRIGQIVWLNGHRREIDQLIAINNPQVGFTDQIEHEHLSEIQDRLSLVAPKQKKLYWQWKIKSARGYWIRCDYYLDDGGHRTDGELNYENWNDLRKQKIEYDFIDIEAD